MIHPLIIGSGPAGISAAQTLVDNSKLIEQLTGQVVKPVVLTEAAFPGGQGLRRLNPQMGFGPRKLYKNEEAKYRNFHGNADALIDQIDYRPLTTVWSLYEGTAFIESAGEVDELPYSHVIIATGATDKIMPVKGWTLPGVYSLGGSQVALKDQGSFIGRKVVFAGSSPLLLLAALQYHRLGAKNIVVLDTTPFRAKLSALPGLRHSLKTAWQGARYMTELKSAGIPIHSGVALEEVRGKTHVESLVFRDRKGRIQTLDCDAVALGYGLRAETQLAELAGCRFEFENDFRQWLPVTDTDGRGAKGIYLAGDGASIGGADCAIQSGKLAALAMLEDIATEASVMMPQAERAGLQIEKRQTQGAVRQYRAFQRNLARIFCWPVDNVSSISDDTVVCRCEGVSAGEIRQSIAKEVGPVEVNRVKAITRCGMGRCQGRFCGLALAEITSQASGRSIEDVGRLRAQAPVKPLNVGAARVVSS